MGGASEDFVNALKSKISDTKIHEQVKRNLLSDAFDVLISGFRNSSTIQVKNVKDFETKDLVLFADLISTSSIRESVIEVFNELKIIFTAFDIDEFRTVFLIDLEKRVISSGSSHNLFIFDIAYKKAITHKARITIHQSDLEYSIYDKDYHFVKFWVLDRKEFKIYTLFVREGEPTRRKKLQTDDEKYGVLVLFNDKDEINSIELTRRKNKSIY